MSHATKVERLGRAFSQSARSLSEQKIDFLLENPSALQALISIVDQFVLGPVLIQGNASTGSNTAPMLANKSLDSDVRRRPTMLTSEKTSRRLEQWPVEPSPSTEELLTTEQVQHLVDLRNRESVHRWRRNGRILGWEGAKRGYVYPAAQFDERGCPLEGLDQVCPHFPDHYAVWDWMTIPLDSLDGQTPLEKLREGEIDTVVGAALADGTGGFS